MKEANALQVKNWCIDTISSSGWTMIASRAYPEIMLCDHKISILNITKHTVFDEEHIRILNKYLLEVYGLQIPEEVSNIKPVNAQSSNLRVEWVDNVSGKMKMSLTFKKPTKWFSRLMGTEK